jgi:predicted HicB family RNase H-like nuclease
LSQPKVRKVGRPKMAKGHAKARIVPVRFNPDTLKQITVAAKASKQTISEWIRSTLNAAIQS